MEQIIKLFYSEFNCLGLELRFVVENGKTFQHSYLKHYNFNYKTIKFTNIENHVSISRRHRIFIECNQIKYRNIISANFFFFAALPKSPSFVSYLLRVSCVLTDCTIQTLNFIFSNSTNWFFISLSYQIAFATLLLYFTLCLLFISYGPSPTEQLRFFFLHHQTQQKIHSIEIEFQ